MLNVLLWLPLAVGLLGFALPRRAVAPAAVVGSLGTLARASRIAVVADFHLGTPASSTRSTRAGSPPSGSATSSASTG